MPTLQEILDKVQKGHWTQGLESREEPVHPLNGIHNDVIFHLCDKLQKDTSVTILDFSEWKLTSSQVESLSTALKKNSTVKKLNLGDSCENLEYFLKALRENVSISEVYIRFNLKYLKEPKLDEFKLGKNIKRQILDLLSANPKIINFGLSYYNDYHWTINNIQDNQIQESLEKNKRVQGRISSTQNLIQKFSLSIQNLLKQLNNFATKVFRSMGINNFEYKNFKFKSSNDSTRHGVKLEKDTTHTGKLDDRQSYERSI